jgi:hypothetical protein
MAELRQGMLTQHGLMVAWGEFAHQIGLIEKLSQVPIPQKSVVHTPQAKVLTFLLGILSGITHLKDLNEGPHPLAHDWAAIRAWGLVSLAHYTGVSRTLAACDEETVAAITQVLHEVAQPFIDREVNLMLRQGCALVIDLDLAPRPVSDTSTTFPGAEFGWQDDRVGLGYDAALATLTCPTYGRLFLAGFHYPRNPIALPRLQKMVLAAEERLGRRPRRRTELVAQRLKGLEETVAQRQAWHLSCTDKYRVSRSTGEATGDPVPLGDVTPRGGTTAQRSDPVGSRLPQPRAGGKAAQSAGQGASSLGRGAEEAAEGPSAVAAGPASGGHPSAAPGTVAGRTRCLECPSGPLADRQPG